MAKKVILFFLMVFCFTTLFGLYSDDFILGSYTYLRGSSDETYFQYLSEANYNCLNASIVDESISNLQTKTNDNNLDIILHDHIWQPENEAVGVYYLTSANNYYYEAEYWEIGQTFDEDIAEKYYYRIHREEDMGYFFEDFDASNNNVWRCREGIDNAGVVCDTLFWKWLYYGDDKFVEKEIILPKQSGQFIMDTLYFDYQLKIDDLSHPDDTQICDLDFYISTKEGDHYIQNNLTLHSYNPFVYDNQLTVGEYNAHDPNNPGYKTFSFYALVDEIDDNLMHNYDTTQPELKNINFKVYWYGNGNLFLDNFRIYDDIYRKLEDGVYDNMLTNRINSLKEDALNLKFLYSKDEPAQPQFDSYRLVEDILDNSQCDSLITAVNKKGCWFNEEVTETYFHHRLFEYMSEPEQIMFDMYPVSSDRKWNCSPYGEDWHIQDGIQTMLVWYKDIKEEICETENIDFLCIPQTQGVYYVDPGHFNNPDRHWGSMRPPSNMQKCLQFLPLCYGADGIIDWKFISSNYYDSTGEENNEPIGGDIDFMLEDTSRDAYQRLALIDEENFPGNNGRSPQYYAIQEANHEISYIGPIVKSLEWVNAGTIDTNGDYPESEFEPYYQNLESISVSGDGFYSGFMECGEFVDTEDDPYFMFVNRKTDHSYEYYMSPGGYAVGIPKNTDIAFYDADPQEITFHFTDPMENYYLIDQYTGGIYDITNSVSEAISIEPGDGMLLKLCQMPLPQEITGTTSVTNAYIPYSVTITSTGTLLIYDNVEFGPYATLTIENGGLAIIWGNVLFGTNSKIIAEGELQINPQNLLNTILTSKINTWQGIECYEGGEIWVQNESIIENAETGIFSDGGEVHVIESTIYNCDYGIVLYNDSSLDFDSSTIIVPDNEIAVGISIVSSINECDIQITGGPALANSVIQGNGVGAGILIASMFNETEKKFNIINTTFDNLDEGFHIEGSEKTDDEISDCTFNNCNTGIYLNGIGSMKHIRDCGFTSNETGIQLNTFQVPIIHCGFISETSGCGIEFDYISGVPIDGPDPGPASVDSCSFYGDITGIRCVNATPRVAHCAFDGTGIGIDVFNKSLIDMAWNGNNSFYTTVHIMFRDSGLINILNGHNDFWDVLFDFIFAGNYDSSNNTLNCNGNYWSDRPLGEAIPYYEYINMMNEPEDFIIADFSRMDDYPNVPPGWDATNRYEEAGILEADGNPIEALALYTTILSEQLEEEKGFWMNCIDRTFNLSLQLNENLYNLVQFYDTFILNIPDFVPIEEREELICFVKNYQKKVYIEMESFQEAADIVIIRIEDPITTVDSLFAVMELESIYYLSSSGGGRSNVMTSYPQHEPEDCKQLQKWHEDHWDEIYVLLGIGENHEDKDNQTIPLVPVLNGNYPNPFNPETKIAFSIPVDSKVNLTIYNIKGQKVKTLVNDQLEKGFHEIIWNSKDNNGKLVASGVYFYKFDVNGKTKGVKKMLLLK